MKKKYPKLVVLLTLSFFMFNKKTNAQGVQTFQSIRMYHPSTQGQYITLLPPNGITSYGLTLPATQGAANQVLTNDGAGILSWATPNTNFWSLTGNASTVDGTNFIGTTDNVPFNIRVNNQKSGRIATNAGTGETMFGYQAGNANVSGFGVTYLGYKAGTLSTASNNTFVGYNSGAVNVTGSNNAFFGTNSGAANTAIDNTFLGYKAGFTNGTGQTNTFVGSQAGEINASGQKNTFIGFEAGKNSTADGNSFNGYQSGRNTTTANNTFMGHQSGITNTTGANNTLLGYNADVSSTGLSNAAAIGYNAKVAASNSMILGGTGADAVNVGMGVTSPSFKLDVNGTGLFRSGNGAGAFTSDQLLFGYGNTDTYRHAIKSRHNSGATTDNALDFFLWKQGTDVSTTTGTLQVMTLQGNNNGSVGIGTTNPQNVLHINNLSAAGDAIKISNAATGSITTDGFDMNHVGLTTSFILNQKENAEFRFATNNIQRATFMGDGKYGIGPAFSAPSEGFHYQWQNAIFEADDNQSAMISGYLGLKNLNDAAYELRFYEPDGCGQNYSAFKAQNQLSNLVYTLPSLAPTVNDVLSVTNVTGSEVSLTWVTPGGGGGGSPVTGTGTPGEIAFWATPTGISSDSRLYWDDATLRFGVGTATPDDMVDVQGNVFITNGSTAASKLKLGEPNYVGGGNFTSFEAQAQAADVTYILPAAGPVSATTGTNSYALLTNSIGNTATLAWQPVWATNGNAGVSTGFLGTTDAQPLAFRANNVERARITSAGQTLIGLAADYTDPIGGTSSLAVAGGGGTRFSIANSSNWMQYSDGTTTALLGHFSGTNFVTGTFSNHDYVVRTNNTEKFRITNTGNVGIGQTTPTEKLEILNGNTLLSNSDNTARELRFAEPSTSGTNYTAFKAQTQAANISYTLPAADGTSGQVLSTNGTGTLSWTAATGGTTNALSISTTNLTSTVNGVASTALDLKPAIKTVAWSKDGNASTSPGTDFIGTTDAQDLVIRTTNTEKLRVTAAGNLGIGITAPAAKVEIDGGLAFKANTTAVTADNQAVTVANRTYLKLNSDGTVTNRTITLSNGLTEGQLLFISVIATATNGVEILDSGNVNLAATASLNNADTLQLLWDGTTWNEITRSNN